MNPQLIQNTVKVVVAATFASAATVEKKYGPPIIKKIGEVM